MIDDLTLAESQTPRDSALEAATAFVAAVKALDTGRLAILRRNSGNSLAEARNVTWFYSLLNRYGRRWDDEILFTFATLLAGDRSLGNAYSFEGDFGATVSQLRSQASNPESVERRFGILLDARFDTDAGGEMSFRLRQMVKLVQSKESPINWPRLLADLRLWESGGKWVQKRWARSFYAPHLPAESRQDNDELTEESEIAR